jgi:hypothetical protein
MTDPLHMHVGLILDSQDYILRDCAYVQGAAWLVACPFCQFGVCHIHRECYKCNVLPVVDLFPAWSS